MRLSAYYQGRTLNYRHNLDTALVLANQAQALSQQLHYAEGQQEALAQQGRIFIKQEKLGKVKQMLSSVSGLTHIRLLVDLGKNKLRPTYSQEANLDSALWYFNQAEQVSNRIGSRPWQQESQMLTGVAYEFKGDCERSKVWFRRVIDARHRAGDQAGELRAWLRWFITSCEGEGICLNDSSEFTRALTLARYLGDKPTELLLLLQSGIRPIILGDQKMAERIALQAISLQKSISFKRYNQAFHAMVEQNDYLEHVLLFNFLDAHCFLADINLLKNDLTKSVLYNLKVIKDLERSGLREDLDWPYFWLGNNYYDHGQYAKGLTYYKQSLAVSQHNGKVVVYVGLIRRMAESLIRKGEARQALQLYNNFISQHLPLDNLNKINVSIGLGRCFTALKQYKLSEKYYLESVALSLKTGDSVGRNYLLSYLHISEFYVATAQYAKAAPYLRRLLPTNKPYKPFVFSPGQLMRLYQLQFKVDSAQAHYLAALHQYQYYTSLKDSVLNETTHKQMAELDVRYQTHQKEQALLLRQKDITLLTQQNHFQQIQRNALIGGTLLLVALLGLGYNRYQLKQRSNQLLQEQQQLIHHKNEALQRLLTEQERLLKEIHHRVKNNLQIVMSLLNSQASYLSDESALSAIQESQHRVQVMALIHQKLYQAQGVARIPMEAYIQDVVAYLHESYVLPQPISFELEVEPIELDVTQAVPLGLIINEAITNALKYAFPAGREGSVQVKLGALSEGVYELVIADDGIGLPADFDPTQSRSLGMTLMYGFSEQLGGQLQIRGQSGMSLRLLFHDETHTVKAYA
ncbi:hypothetical protein GCM10027190_44410 [Spirosoma areae]